MWKPVKRANLQRCASVTIILLGVAFFAAAMDRASLVQGQEKDPPAAKKDAVEKDGDDKDKKGGGSGLFDTPIFPLLIVMVLFFFFIILPAQRRQKKEQAAVLANLKKNDEVVTAAGIIGIVSFIKENEDEVTLKIDDNARIKVLKSSIVRIKNKEEPKDAAGNPIPAPATPPGTNTNVKPAT